MTSLIIVTDVQNPIQFVDQKYLKKKVLKALINQKRIANSFTCLRVSM